MIKKGGRLMDWEEEERIRQEKRAQRRRLHEKLSQSAKQDYSAESQPPKGKINNHKSKTSSEPDFLKTNLHDSSESVTKEKNKKERAKFEWPKFKKKAHSKSKEKSSVHTDQESNSYLPVELQEKKDKQSKKAPKQTSWLQRIVLLAPFIIAMIIAGYYVSPLNHVASISVQGIEEQDGLNIFPLKEQMSVTQLKNRTGEIEQTIVNQNPSVKSATISVGNWNQITLNVSAYRQIGYIQIADFFYPLLENDQILDTPLPTLEKALPLFEGYDISNEDQRVKLTETVKTIASLPDDVIQQIDLITYMGDENNEDRIAFQMTDGNVVIGFINTIGEKMSYYNGIASQLDGQIGLIDMEVAIFFTELNAGNNPYASKEDKAAYEESVAKESESKAAASTSLETDASNDNSEASTSASTTNDSIVEASSNQSADQSSTAAETR